MPRKLTTDNIAGISPYVPGKPVEELERELGITGSIKLASNENPLGPSPKAVEAVKGALSKLHRYPDGSGYHLKRAIAGRLGVKPANIVLGNGSNELLEMAVRTFLWPGGAAVMGEPSFVVYKLVTQSAGGESVVVPLKDGVHDLGAMAKAVTDKTKLLFVANPNNPTGTMNTRDEFRELMDAVPRDVIVVMDEAYFEYVTDAEYPDTISCIKDGRRVMAMRTFSKAYGLAGLRVGYAVMPEELAGYMERVRQPFNVNSVALAGALAAIDDDDHVRRSVEVNEAGKAYLYGELDRLGVNYYKTHANFVYMDLGSDARAANDALLRQGVIIRPMGPAQIRATIGLQEENERFVKAFEGYLSI
jgi:histidinol-phosphate aminotransferase